MRRIGCLALVVCALVAASCGDSGEPGGGDRPVEEPTPTTVAPAEDAAEIEVKQDSGLIYLRDEYGDWTLRVFYPDSEGPWPLIVVIPPQASVAYAGFDIASRGAVAVVADAWARPEGWASDPGLYLYGEMDRAACIVGWAQAHAADYGADAAVTTVDGFSGGAMAAAWVGLGQADDSACSDKIVELPVGLVLGESEFLFHHERWDPYFESGDPQPMVTVDGLINPDRWMVAPDLRVGLWSAEHPLGETRAIENPPGEDSWIWLRDDASPFMDDFITVGALDDSIIDWADNANLMELRMQQAGIDVRNEVFPIPHRYKDEVYDLIFSIQS